MIFSKIEAYEDIIKKLNKKEDKIALISCNTCARTCGNGGIQKLTELGLRLIRDGYNVTDEALVLYACSEPILREAKLDLEANTIIVLSCSAGWACFKRNFADKKVLKVTEDIGLVMTDTDKEIFKVIMAYKGHESELGKEFRINTGEPLVSKKILVRCV